MSNDQLRICANTMAASKRKRDENDSAFSGSRFSFNFSGAIEDTSDAASVAPVVAESHPESASIKLQCAVGDSVLTPGTLISIDWARSSWLKLYVRVKDTPEAIEGWVHPQYVSLPRHRPWTFNADDETWCFDYVFDPTFAGCRLPLHFSTAPLIIEPNLQSLVWPLHLSTFQREVNKKAIVVHGSTHRLESLREELYDFDVNELIQNASRTIAWLKQAAPPHKMQYLDVSSPEIAAACYASGHSLYFNPSPEIQERYISALCSDLGLNFTSTLDGSYGGDIEIFAVQSKHHTPWHFDAQHTFTIQLKGTKQWSFAKAPLTDPMTNLHISSSNTTSVLEDTLTHAMCGAAQLTPPTTDFDTVTLRPGSVLYIPPGYWHNVTSFEEGSLSMNFSIDGSRWMDLLWNRLMPVLAGKPEWRERPNFIQGAENARQQWKARLHTLAETIQKMADSADLVFPDAIFQEAELESNLSLDRSDIEVRVKAHDKFKRTPVHVAQLVTLKPLEYTIAMGGYRKYADGCKAECQKTLVIPDGLKPAIEELRVNDNIWTLESLQAQVDDAALHPKLYRLVEYLFQCGYLQTIPE
ncbi:unnamed protein product [Aphanomyces euteiches]